MSIRVRALTRVIVLLLAAAGWSGGVFADAPQSVFLATSERSREGVEAAVRAAGGELIAVVPETGVALARIDDTGLETLRSDRRVAAAARGVFAALDLSRLSGAQRDAAGAWQRMRLLESSPTYVRPQGSPLIHDTIFPQTVLEESTTAQTQFSASIAVGGRPYGASDQNTSEYMAGPVSINLLLLESIGIRTAASEDWDGTKEAQILAEALSAADALVSLHPHSNLQFVIHPYYGRTDTRVQTTSEPIANRADPGDTTTGIREDTWTKEVLAKFGYTSGNRTYRSRQLADATRIQDHTDWAVNVFVINSFKDADGMFSDGFFAYSYVGGPHVVVTYDNDSWGVSNFHLVLAHELHHSFFALDEYSSSGCTCSQASGYLGAANLNCEACNSSPEPCAMRDNQLVACQATRREVGTLDTDGDGTPDILETPPLVSLQLADGPDCLGATRIGGSAEVGRRPNLNPTYATPTNAISILTITGVEYRLDNGAWKSGVATADDGAFDGPLESYSLPLSLTLGDHAVDVRSVDSRGNRSDATRLAVTATGGTPAASVGDSLRVAASADSVALSWTASNGASLYAIRRASTPAALAKAVPLAKVAGTSWSDAPAGTAFYSVSAINPCGAETP